MCLSPWAVSEAGTGDSAVREPFIEEEVSIWVADWTLDKNTPLSAQGAYLVCYRAK